MRIFGFGLLTALVMLWAISCSSSSSEPVTPGSSFVDNPANDFPLYVSDFDVDGSPSGGSGALGVFEVHIDTNTLEYEMNPLRSNAGSTKDTLEVIDVTNFMTLLPCRDCATLLEVGYTGTYDRLNLRFGIKHPFAAPNFSEPISGRNRADLHIFNVEGMLVFADNATLYPELGVRMSTIDRLANADGYSGYLDESLDNILPTNADIHPYKTFFVNYEDGNYDPSNEFGFASLVSPSGYMVMRQGSLQDTRFYHVNHTPGEQLDFLFVVQASWGASTENYTQRFQAVYDCPQFNKKAASFVEVEVIGDLIAGDPSSACDVDVNVLDINYDTPVGTGLGEMLDESTISSIKIEVPNVTSGVLEFVNPTPLSGDPRDPQNPLHFEFEIRNLDGETEGTYNGLVEVIDSYAPKQNPNPIIGDNDGAERVEVGLNPLTGLIEIDHFSTYMSLNVVIAEANQPPVAVFHTVPPADCYLPREVDILIDASDSFDPNFGSGPCGDVVQYEFDFEWNGVPADFSHDYIGPDSAQTYQFLQSGPNVIGVRVTDGCVPQLSSPIESLNVIIGNPEEFRPEQTQLSRPMETNNNPLNPFQPVLNTTPMCVSGNNVYVAWTAHDTVLDLDYVYCARSADGGCTWGDADKIYHHANCAVVTYVFVALDTLADGSPILMVISPGTVTCNFQAWFFIGRNLPGNAVDWGEEHAADLYGAKSAFIDLKGHPTDETIAYMVQWRYDDNAPNNLMFVKVKYIGSPEPWFPHWEVDVGQTIYNLDLELEEIGPDPKMHVVYTTNTQVKYLTLMPTELVTPVVEGPITVTSVGENDSKFARLTLDRFNMPIVVYQSKYPGTDYNVLLKAGTGSPVTFPATPDFYTDMAGDQLRPELRYNEYFNDWWMVYDDDGQIYYETLDSSFTSIANGVVNTEDPGIDYRYYDPSIVFNPDEHSTNVVWVRAENAPEPYEVGCVFNRTN